MNKNIPELLAPAGSMIALKAAVNAGADAVYLAGKRFGARHYAANFDDDQLKEAVNYAHSRGVKVYVTVNTLIKEHEIQKVARYLLFLYETGVDAILVQDIGVTKLAREIVPQLNLHASTQMTIHNLEGVKWASRMGFKRVVLSREMEIAQIKKIGENLKSEEIELEIFAHGALCYSYSGQCLLSSFIGGRSGNRGMCAQPCRRKYTMVCGEKDEYGRPSKLSKVSSIEDYVLSTRDLSLYEHLSQIVNLNVHSLKIEGRMRSPEYVAIVVSIYRKALDSIAHGKWEPDDFDINNLKFAFNRDFTPGYILEISNVMGRDRPGNRGVYVGSVNEYNKKNRTITVEIKGGIIPQKGDGIVLISRNHEKREYGMVLTGDPEIYKNKIKFKINFPLKKGTVLYITRRKELLDKAKKIIAGTFDDLKNQIMVDLDVLIQDDGIIIIKSKFNGANGPLELKKTADFKMEQAKKTPLSKETIKNQLTRTGGTPFQIESMEIHYPGNLFAPLSKLNKFRRDLFEEIRAKIISSYLPSKEEILNSKKSFDNGLFKPNSLKKPPKKAPDLGIYINDIKTLKGAIDGGCRRIYFDPFIQTSLKCKTGDLEKVIRNISEARDICISSDAIFILKLPKITNDSYLKEISEIIKQVSEINVFMVDGMGAAEALRMSDDSIELYGSSGLNIWNHLSVEELSKSFKGLIISPELSKKEIKSLISNVHPNISLELVIEGNMESIVSRDCIPCIKSLKKISGKNMFLGLQDVKDRVFPVSIDTECHTYIFNAVETCLIDYLPFISNIAVDTVIVDARGRSEKYVSQICSIYTEALQLTAKGSSDIKKLNSLKNKIKKISLGGITTGNFLKGVKEK